MYVNRKLIKVVLGSFLSLAATCHAADRSQIAFVPEDEWVFQQVREKPGSDAEINPDIRFKVAKMRENWVAHMIALTDKRVPVWSPKWKLPEENCMQDFVGMSDLALPSSCETPLAIGMAWEDASYDGKQKTVLKFQVVSKEDLQLKAGKFLTIKIIEEGKVYEQRPGGVDILVSNSKSTYWFSHDAKAFVRVIREYGASEGTPELRITEELKRYKVRLPQRGS